MTEPGRHDELVRRAAAMLMPGLWFGAIRAVIGVAFSRARATAPPPIKA